MEQINAALNLAILVGEFVIIGMVWHTSNIARAHHMRADLEWQRLSDRSDVNLSKVMTILADILSDFKRKP